MKTQLSVLAFLLAATSLAFGQDQTPRPGPEIQKLGYYVGTWKGHGESKGGPFGPAGKLSSNVSCEWFVGGFQVVCRGEERGPTGKRAFLNLKSFDQATKTYTEYSISSAGESEYALGGSLAGGTLTYVMDAGSGEDAAKIRYTEEHVSPALFTYKAEASLSGGPWTTIAEGELEKVR